MRGKPGTRADRAGVRGDWESIGPQGQLPEKRQGFYSMFVYLEVVRHRRPERASDFVSLHTEDGATGAECPLALRPLAEEQQRRLSLKLKLPRINFCVSVTDNKAITQGSCTGPCRVHVECM